MTKRYHSVVEADIKGYFNNIDHQKLIARLEKRIDDKPFLKLIKKWLKAGILGKHQVIYPEAGTPQGGTKSAKTKHSSCCLVQTDKRKAPF